MLNKREILEDFSVYVLLQYEELISQIVYFFEKRVGDEIFNSKSKPVYDKFISDELYFDNIRIDFNSELPTKIEFLEDILKTEEIEIFCKHLKENFREGYPDDYDEDTGFAYGGNYPINLDIVELKSYFKEYVKLRSYNDSVYISYLYLMLNFSENKSYQNFKYEVEELEKNFYNNSLLPIKLSEDYIEFQMDRYKTEFFKTIEKEPFQFQGFYDANGFFIDIDLTLKYWLKLYNVYPISYKPHQPQIKNELNFILLQYVYFKLKNQNFPLSENRELDDIKNQYEKLKKENQELVQFLETKKFEDKEIEIILNTLTGNLFNELSIRWINLKQVDFFRFCHLFFIFDFYREIKNNDFQNESDFNCLSLDTNALKNNNQLKKYYDNKTSEQSHRHYPFTKIDDFIEQIQNKLQIVKGKLKQIPKSNFY